MEINKNFTIFLIIFCGIIFCGQTVLENWVSKGKIVPSEKRGSMDRTIPSFARSALAQDQN